MNNLDSQTARTLSLMAATIAAGLAAGTFSLYAHTIMPGLKQTDDRTFVASFQAIDRAIINPWFIGGTFLGGLALTIVAAISNRSQPAFRWIIIALIFYCVVVGITLSIHVLLNDALKFAEDVNHVPNLAQVRRQFYETTWAKWNLIRTGASLGAFTFLAWALTLHRQIAP